MSYCLLYGRRPCLPLPTVAHVFLRPDLILADLLPFRPGLDQGRLFLSPPSMYEFTSHVDVLRQAKGCELLLQYSATVYFTTIIIERMIYGRRFLSLSQDP